MLRMEWFYHHSLLHAFFADDLSLCEGSTHINLSPLEVNYK